MPKDEPGTQQTIRRESADLFARRGYGGTSMAQIAGRVGIRKASLYNYYESKEELLLDLVERSVSDWETACLPAFDGQGSCEQRLASYFQAIVRFAAENPQAVAIVRLAATQVGGEPGRNARAILDRHEQESAAKLACLFEAAIEAGEIRALEPFGLTRFWGAFIDGILINQLFATPKAAVHEAHLEELWAMFWRGLTGRLPGGEKER